MRKVAVLLALSLCGHLVAAQVTATPGEKLSSAILKLKGNGGEVKFPCGSYEADETINIAVDGVWLRGSGYCSRIHVTTNKDVFNVTKAFFLVEGFEIIIDSTADRSEANFIRAGGNQGRIDHVRFTGSPHSPNNGRIFYGEGPVADEWVFQDIRMTDGVTWRALVAVDSPTARTLAGTVVINAQGGVSMSDAAFDLNGAIDTFLVSSIQLALRHGYVFRLRNTFGSPIAPRWVMCNNCSIETRGSTAIQLDACRSFSYRGYVSGADLAVYVGKGAADTDLSHIVFPAMIKGAITIAAGSVNTQVKDNFFEDTTNGGASFDSITVEPGASNFQISGNMWRSTNNRKARYAISIGQGASNYRLQDNQIANDVANGAIANAAGGSNFVVSGNTGTPDKSSAR